MSVAVVGCGYWGKNVVRSFAQLGALSAVVDFSPAAAEREAAAHGVAARTWEAALADPAVTAISLATPAELHFDQSMAALKAGKDVLVEKPIALTAAEGEALGAAAAAGGRVLMVGHLLRYHPAFEALLDLVQAGRIGAVRYAHSNRLSMGKFRLEENVLWSFAPHDVSMLLALFGAEPLEVRAAGGAFATAGIEDEVQVDLLFPGGRHGHVFASWLHPFKEHRLVVVGETGSLVFDDTQPWDRKLLLYPYALKTGAGAPEAAKGEAEAIAVEQDEPLKRECAHFLQACRDRSTPRTDAQEALAVLGVLSQAQACLEGAGGR
jgi:UDP-2-acetamido-3-amino-2,3-dideoxy-glucuronate N-acetyltransferase